MNAKNATLETILKGFQALITNIKFNVEMNDSGFIVALSEKH